MSRHLALLLFVLALLLAGCKDKSVAEVAKHEGDLKRDTASAVGAWEPAADGAKLNLGDGLKTGPNAEAVIRLTRGGKLKMPPETTIRFLATAPGATSPRLTIEAGEASVEADNGEVLLETSIGTARIESGGAIKLTPTEGGTRIELSLGAARIETADGGLALTAGKAFEVSLGGAVIERDPKAPEDAGTTAAEVDAGPAVDPGAAFVDVHDRGVRRQAKGSTTWQALADGAAAVNAGDTIDVPAGAAIEIRRGGQQARVVGAGRVVVGEAGGALARATAGKVEIAGAGEDTRMDVPGGALTAKAGKSRVDAEIAAAGTKVAVKQGDAEVKGAGAAEALKVGDTATLSSKGVVVVGRGPAIVDFTVRAGDSIVIRDPKPPTAVGMELTALCPGGGVVTRGESTSVRGERKANVSFPAGYNAYSVRCIGPDGVEDKPAATGTIAVIADAAKAELPRLPPSSVVDTDGRRYTILYQNLLPSFVVRWPDAPAGGSYVLYVDKNKRPAGPARVTLAAGAIGEGTHTLKFETADGGKGSPETTVVVKFDNAAPAASLREPADGSFAPGASVNVAGVVVEGWSVSIAGQPVALDEHQRFSTTATPVPGENAIVLRLSHKQHGVVYYVRHAAPAGAKP
ncbi:MAG: hypothetical protein KIT84_38190 [Labilithrix sp.]|nr:hypothetical protein [Labilithrix sp.]MCW5816890.1 hypothetical protein [Labilithrix sp.]